jgi:hypothetical protein
LTQRLHAGFVRSHFSFRALHETQANGSVPAGAAEAEVEGSDSVVSGGMAMATSEPHPVGDERQDWGGDMDK